MKPAVATPWVSYPAPHNGQNRYHYTISLFNDQRRVADVDCTNALGDGKQNADYIAHAANAYPKLVAALRDHVAFSPNTPTSDAARALLAKLGEEV